jgi:hypothetical protein
VIKYLVVLGSLTVSGSLYGQATSGLPAPPTVSVSAYGAKCNWNGSTGTDDSVAFQAASNAASASYAGNGIPVTITVPNGCTLGTSSGHTTITVGSGVHWQGPGSIFVPMQSTNELFLTLSTNDVSFEGLTITMVSNTSGCGPSQNNDLCSAIRWNGSSSGTGTAYKKFYARNNTIINSGWGITVLAQAGLDTLSDIHIDGNTIIESALPVTAYQYADAIHVGGGVSAITISHNMATGRGDAGIALSTEISGSTVRQCQFATVTGNTLYEDRVGIDNSGCSNVQVTGNLVMADISTSTSNPAFRSIYYNATPVNVNVTGNTFRNYQGTGTDVTAKFDCEGGCGTNLNSKFTGNKFFTTYFRGSMIDVSDNTVEAGGAMTFDWDTVNSIGSYYITVGSNGWQNGGTVNFSGTNAGVYFDDFLAPQVGAGISYTNPTYFNAISANFASLTVPTATAGTNTTQAASTAFVAAATANQAATNVANIFTVAQVAPAFWPQSKSAGPQFVYFDDFITGANTATNSIGTPTSASCSVNVTYADINHPGQLLLTSGTGGSGTGITCGTQSESADFFAPNSSSLGWTWETAVYVPVLPGSTAGSFQAGLASSPNANPWTSGIQFYLSSGNSIVNDWYCRYSSTSTDSTVAAVAATWTRLTMVNDGTYVHWYINGTEATACKTAVGSMPSSAQYPASWSATALSTSSVSMAVDYVDVQRATAR